MMRLPFVIEILLETPVLSGRRLHLDAVLAGIAWRRTRSFAAVQRFAPIDTLRGVALASELMMESPVTRIDLQRFGGVNWRADVKLSMIADHRRSKQFGVPVVKIWQPELENPITSTAAAWISTRAWFIGCGDGACVADTIASAGAIGAKTSGGWGRIASIELRSAALSEAAAWLDDEHSPRRAIPIETYHDFLAELGADPGAHRIVDETAQIPYDQRGRRTACAVRPDVSGAPISIPKEALHLTD